MKIIGISLIFIGIVALLKNMGYFADISWGLVFPVFLIVLGAAIAFKKGCGSGLSCSSCKGGKCDEKVCDSCKK